MGMRDDDRGQLARSKSERSPVELLELVVPLVESAINQDLGVAPSQVGAATGNGAAGAAESDFTHAFALREFDQQSQYSNA